MQNDGGLRLSPLGFPWVTRDPFLFCVHHLDTYPAGNAELGPRASLAGRNLGMDFELRDGWRMYHGQQVPGFPQHPHRGFETITIARRGYIDHADSLGATARFGEGDVQWMTAGGGIVHSEMFPLLDQTGPNVTELFQIWLNLPARNKLVEPHFAMLWAPTIPVKRLTDTEGRTAEIRVVAGELDGARAPAPPPHSWASEPDAHVAVLTLRLEPGARLTLPEVPQGVQRSLYFFAGASLSIDGQPLAHHAAVHFDSPAPLSLVNGPQPSELLLLQGRPLGEPVAHYGPFVMNTPEQVRQAMDDYHRTQFGGWPWPSHEPVHPATAGRFARHADGRLESPDGRAGEATPNPARVRAKTFA